MSDWVEEAAAKWLRMCGSCDAGLPMGCTCLEDDPRPVIMRLVHEVQALRKSANAVRGSLPLGDPRGLPEYQGCVTDLCAAQRRHIAGCPEADKQSSVTYAVTLEALKACKPHSGARGYVAFDQTWWVGDGEDWRAVR